mgnify:CR=1 FL=1
MTAFFIALHALAAAIWVGGMFFAYVVLRPSVASLAAVERAALWEGVLGRFFVWVGAAVLVLLVSGYWLVLVSLGGLAAAGMHVHLMQLTGWLMFLLFGHLVAVPWRRFRRARAAGDTAGAGRWLAQIRTIVLANLLLGLVTIALGASGRFWG